MIDIRAITQSLVDAGLERPQAEKIATAIYIGQGDVVPRRFVQLEIDKQRTADLEKKNKITFRWIKGSIVGFLALVLVYIVLMFMQL